MGGGGGGGGGVGVGGGGQGGGGGGGDGAERGGLSGVVYPLFDPCLISSLFFFDTVNVSMSWGMLLVCRHEGLGCRRSLSCWGSLVPGTPLQLVLAVASKRNNDRT